MQCALSPWLLEHLVCPRDHLALKLDGDCLVCFGGDRYTCVDGIPVMILSETRETDSFCRRTFEEVENRQRACTEETPEVSLVHGVDTYVQETIVRGAGRLYDPKVRKLTGYPIPKFPLALTSGKTLLDIGCDWGRWSISAFQQGYQVVGIDPLLSTVRAARRVARQCGIGIDFLVAEATHLPFSSQSFDVVFSYAVFQHFPKKAVAVSLAEVSRTLKTPGMSLIQMANQFGLRNLATQIVNRFQEAGFFGVRFWAPAELARLFSQTIGPTTVAAQQFFVLNAPPADSSLLPRRYRLLVKVSAALTRTARRVPGMVYLADSVWVRSVRD
jgi:2-polyprenyl-3-methyl-5-hydroxy-6-metoxy-1,4-benzoquinol methylase